MSVRVNLRLPDDLWAEAVAKGKRDDTSATHVVKQALRTYLGLPVLTEERFPLESDGNPVDPDSPAAIAVRAVLEAKPPRPFKCPDNRCDFTAGSENAKCPRHGRKVTAA